MRGQATSINMPSEEVRNTKIPEALELRSFDGSTTNNKHALSNKLPTYLQSLVCVGSARPSTALTGLGSDVSDNLSITVNTWKPPDISSLHNVIRTGIRLIRTDANFYFSIRIIRLPPNRARGPRPSLGGPPERSAQRARQRQDRIWWS